MDNTDKIKNTICDLIYLRDINNPRLQKIVKMDKDDINSHLYNAGSLINQNELLDEKCKKELHNYIIGKIKK